MEGKDLFVENDHVYMKTVKGPLKVDCIYRRIDDNFMDPKVFFKGSLLGVPAQSNLFFFYLLTLN